MDILFESCNVAVSLPQPEKDVIPDGRSTVKGKTENLDNIQTRNQVMAQTIVFSLLQRKMHPWSEHFLIPNIVANGKALKFFFYDAKNDILLESRKYDLVYEKLPYRIVLQTVIATWLVLNHKILCSGPYEDYLEKAPRSKFRKHAEKVLSIYDDELQFRNLNLEREQQKPFCEWSKLAMEHYTFKWPACLRNVPPLPGDKI